jgi:hypothetical protein
MGFLSLRNNTPRQPRQLRPLPDPNALTLAQPLTTNPNPDTLGRPFPCSRLTQPNKITRTLYTRHRKPSVTWISKTTTCKIHKYYKATSSHTPVITLKNHVTAYPGFLSALFYFIHLRRDHFHSQHMLLMFFLVKIFLFTV